MRLSAQFTQQGVFDLFPGYVLHVQNPALGMTALFAKIKLAMSRNLAFIELQTELSQLADTLRTLSHNRAYDSFITQTRSRFKREIGRASCRESVSSPGGAGSVRKRRGQWGAVESARRTRDM